MPVSTQFNPKGFSFFITLSLVQHLWQKPPILPENRKHPESQVSVPSTPPTLNQSNSNYLSTCYHHVLTHISGRSSTPSEDMPESWTSETRSTHRKTSKNLLPHQNPGQDFEPQRNLGRSETMHKASTPAPNLGRHFLLDQKPCSLYQKSNPVLVFL